MRSSVLIQIAKSNISQRRLARLCQVSSGYMTQLLRGDRYPGPAVRERILGALPGIGFDEVFEEVM